MTTWEIEFDGKVNAVCKSINVEFRSTKPNNRNWHVSVLRLVVGPGNSDAYQWLSHAYDELDIPPQARRDIVLRDECGNHVTLFGAAPIWVNPGIPTSGILGGVKFHVVRVEIPSSQWRDKEKA